MAKIMSKRTALVAAGVLLLLLLALYVAPFANTVAEVGFADEHEKAQAQDGEHVHGGVLSVEPTPTGLNAVTLGSPSDTGYGYSVLKDSKYGPNTLHKVCDTRRDGVIVQAAVYNIDGYFLDGITDRNAAKPGCGFQFYFKGKAQHKKITVFRVGECSVHRYNEGGQTCRYTGMSRSSDGGEDVEEATPYSDPELAPPPDSAASASAAAE